MEKTKQSWMIAGIVVVILVLALIIFLPSNKSDNESNLEDEISQGLIDGDSNIDVGEITIPENLQTNDITIEVEEDLIDENSDVEIGELFEF
ncbi:hypothetical protein HOD88_01525 [archaeon]|jgi:hypothetical protein|nr:hypothetical protein [archaeon]